MLEIFLRAARCRAFEDRVFKAVQGGNIKCPVYLSSGQEYIPCTIALWMDRNGLKDRQVFIQHRGHSTYLAFGGSEESLWEQLHGPQGSASIYSDVIYGHDGMMGSQVPIAVGACFANRKPTVCFMGDAAIEEDYALAALGWAATQNLPILFVVEDNNLAILTEKRVRRSWSIANVAKGFGLEAIDTEDEPRQLLIDLDGAFTKPRLLNVRTHRLYWHAGAGVDLPQPFDRHKQVGLSL